MQDLADDPESLEADLELYAPFLARLEDDCRYVEEKLEATRDSNSERMNQEGVFTR